MAELTPKQIAAAMKRGAKAEVLPKHVKVSEPLELKGLENVAEQIQRMAESQQRSQQMLLDTLNRVVEVIEDKQLQYPDMQGAMRELVTAVLQTRETVTKGNTVMDYQADIERNQRGLMESVRFTAVPKEVH